MSDLSRRPGALIAGTWAAMQYMGEKYVIPPRSFHTWLADLNSSCSGYRQSAKNIIAATRKIIHDIKAEIPELYILGNPPVSVVAFGAKEGSGINVLKVGDTMSKKGWHLNALQNPAAVHIAVTVKTFPLSAINCFLIFSSHSHHHPIDPDGIGCGYIYCRPQGRREGS